MPVTGSVTAAPENYKFIVRASDKTGKVQTAEVETAISGRKYRIAYHQYIETLPIGCPENENDHKRKIGLAIGARKGDVIEYFETDNNKEGYSLNAQDISIKKYKIMLWKAIKDILEIAGFNMNDLKLQLSPEAPISMNEFGGKVYFN